MLTKILYVEDNDCLREITSQLLALSGYNVIAVSNGLEALELFKQVEFDLIITDIFMPVMNGNEFIAELAKIHICIPILVLSYNVFDVVQNPFITVIASKPFTTDELRESIIRALQVGEKNKNYIPLAS